jgi:hypothetical protein
MLLATAGQAQVSFTLKAYKAFQEEKLDLAKAYIDSAIANEEEVQSAQTWHIRGFVYRDIYKVNESKMADSPAREEALRAFLKSHELDQTGEFKSNNIKGIKYIATSFYNQGVYTLNPTEYIQSIASYDRYKQILLQIEPNHDFREQDVTYYNALGSMLSETYEKNKIKYAECADLAIKYLHKTLELDVENLTANQQIGVLYYNRGVDLILALDPEASLDVLIETQDKCVELFLKSEPYLLAAHKKDPTNCEIMTGLKGVRFNLNDKEQVKLWDEKLRELGCPVED